MKYAVPNLCFSLALLSSLMHSFLLSQQPFLDPQQHFAAKNGKQQSATWQQLHQLVGIRTILDTS